MKHVLAKKNFLLLRDDGSIVYPISKFITDRFGNPHTRELAAQSLRVFYRFCSAHHIDLSLLAVEGRCLPYNQAKQLADLCYRPLPELEKLSDGQIVRLTSSKAGKRPEEMTRAVEPNTAKKRLNHIATFLNFYREVFLAPNIRARTLSQQLKEDYDRVAHQLKTTITGTKQGHHHDIKSLPSDKFLAIIRAVYKCTDELFVSENGKASRTNLRDRAMVLLACEGLRPGTIGNVARADFRQGSNHLVIKDNRGNRPQTTTNTPVLKLGASTQVNSASETMIELWPFTVDAIQNYIDIEREAVLAQHLQNHSAGFLFLNEKGRPIKHRSSITTLFNRIGQRLTELGFLDVGSDPYFRDQAQYDFYGYVLRHSAASLFLEVNGTDDRVLDRMKIRFGWTVNSKQPERYAARALSDRANVSLMEFSADLMSDAATKSKKVTDY